MQRAPHALAELAALRQTLLAPAVMKLKSLCKWFVATLTASFVLTALMAAKQLYEDEDSEYNDAYVGSPGVQRVRLRRSGTSSEGELAYVYDLDGLMSLANSRFAMRTTQICTTSGQKVRSLQSEDGSTCMADELRCIWDGSTLFAAQRGEVCGPPLS